MTEGGDFIDLAAKMALATNANTPSYRTAVSRAYYGAFHLARAMLAEMGYRCRVRDNEHLFVQRHFANCRQHEAREVGGLLANLHESRKEADYDFDKPRTETRQFALLCVKGADRVREQLKACRQDRILPI